MRLRMSMIVAMLLTLAAQGMAQTTQPSPEVAAADAAMAEQFAQYAQVVLAGKQIVPATLRQSAALLELASRMNPAEPRFLRLLTEAYLQLGEDEGRDGAMSSLTRYLQLEPTDLVAQLRLIDLHYAEIQTADARMKYLQQLLATVRLSAEVRAHVALMAARLASERMENAQAQELLEKALSLQPLFPEAIQMKYRQLSDDAPPAERIGLLLQMLRANPGQPVTMAELAGRLADVGLVDPSLMWFQRAFDLSQRTGVALGPDPVAAYAAEMVIADQLRMAEPIIAELMGRDPAATDAAFLNLMVQKRGGDKDKIQSASDKVRLAAMTALARISDHINGRSPGATVDPSSVKLDDDIKKLAEFEQGNMIPAYATALADLAWLDIYFNSKPADAEQAMIALRKLLPADSVILARLEGWSFLSEGKKQEAKVKLSAVADRDPLSALGLLRAEEATPVQMGSMGKRLLNENASGLVGALLIEALRDQIGLMPPAPGAAEVRAALADFPIEWLDFLDFSKVKRFYSLKAEPSRVSYEYGDPMLATVTITNVSNFDITVGEQGALRPELWFDVQVKGLLQHTIPGVAIDRIGQTVVLKPRDTISMTVRVDQDGLSGLLEQNPAVSLPLYFSVLTNPMTQPTGIAPGPGGHRASFSRVMERGPSPWNEQTLQEMYRRLVSGSSVQRMHTMSLAAAFAQALRKSGGEPQLARAAELTDAVRKRTGDMVVSVGAYATYHTAMLSDENVRNGIIKQMLLDPSYQQRVLGLMAAQAVVPPAQRKEWVMPMSDGEADPLVRKLAEAVLEVADMPATTQPATTQPATTAPAN